MSYGLVKVHRPHFETPKVKKEWCKGQRSAKFLLQRLSQTTVTTVRFNLHTNIVELLIHG